MNENPFDNDEINPHGLPDEEKGSFHGWRLLGIIFIVIVVLAGISAAVDIIVIGPLEGRI